MRSLVKCEKDSSLRGLAQPGECCNVRKLYTRGVGCITVTLASRYVSLYRYAIYHTPRYATGCVTYLDDFLCDAVLLMQPASHAHLLLRLKTITMTMCFRNVMAYYVIRCAIYLATFGGLKPCLSV